MTKLLHTLRRIKQWRPPEMALTGFFAANEDDLAGLDMGWGPAPYPTQEPKETDAPFVVIRGLLVGPTLPTVASVDLAKQMLEILDQLVTGAAESLASIQPIDLPVGGDEAGARVFPVSKALLDALAGLDEPQAHHIGREWAQNTVGLIKPDESWGLADLVDDLAHLARAAIHSNRNLYLWVSP